MAQTYVRYPAEPGATEFDIPFPYQSIDDLVVTLGDTVLSFTLISATRLLLNAPVATAGTLEVRRRTNTDTPSVIFRNNSILTEDDLNRSVEQVLFKTQEIAEVVEETIAINPSDFAETTAAAAEALLVAQQTRLDGGRFALAAPLGAVRTVKQRLEEMPISVTEFEHLVVDGYWDDAFQAACNAKFRVHMPARPLGYRLRRGFRFAEGGNFLTGDGHAVSRFKIGPEFDLTRRYVISCPPSGSENGSGVDNIGFEFEQPVTSVRANLIAYPWALDFTNVSRGFIDRLRIEGAARGINLQGNTGGFYLGRLEVGAYIQQVAMGGLPIAQFTCDGSRTQFSLNSSLAVWPARTSLPVDPSASTVTRKLGGAPRVQLIQGVDYSWVGDTLILTAAPSAGTTLRVDHIPNLDFTFIDTYLGWPFGFQTGPRLVAWSDGQTTAIDFGRCDGLGGMKIGTFRGRVTTSGVPFEDDIQAMNGPIGSIGHIKLDGDYANLTATAGRLELDGWYSSSNANDDFALEVTGNATLVTGPGTVFSPQGATRPLIDIRGGHTTLGPLNIANGPKNHPIVMARDSGALVMTAGTQILVGTNTTRTVGMVVVTDAARLILSNVQFPVPGQVETSPGSGVLIPGGGPAIEVRTNGKHVVTNNDLNGWELIGPPLIGSTRQAVIRNNTNPALYRVPAASTMTLRSDVDAYEVVAGSSTVVGNIAGTYEGHVVTLTINTSVAFAQGGVSLFLAHNQPYAPSLKDTLTLMCVNGAWHEVSRSARADIWQVTNPTVTASSGTLGGANATLTYRRRYDGTFEGNLAVVVSARGSAVGPLRVAMPFASVDAWSLCGGEVAISGRPARFTMGAGTSVIDLVTHENDTPGTGSISRLGFFTYRL